MPRIALGLVAALAATSLTAGAQAGFGDPARVAGGQAVIRTVAQTGAHTAGDAAGAGPVVNAPVRTPATTAAARIAGAPRSAAALARRAPTPAGPMLNPPQTAKERRGMKYMFIGGGVLLTGAIVDDDAGDILMVGGLVFALYGLWIFLN